MTNNYDKEALAYLESHHVMTLATFGTEGPWAAAVFYINQGFTLYFLTESHTRHGRNIQANPLISGAIHEDYHDWREIKGIQFQGEAVPVTPIEKARVLTYFITKFPSVQSFISIPRYMTIIARSLLYRIKPHELWYLDNQKGFSRREKVNLSHRT